ncbi:hypothetical protein BH10ACT7_BH10ACT7_08380 [soil metagenome]
MLAIQATGRVVRDARGLELYLTRLVPAPLTDVWKWISSPGKTKKWLPSFRLLESTDLTRLAADIDGSPITFSLVEVDGGTRIFLSQRLTTTREAGVAGPAWEYRLDSLLASIAGSRLPAEQDYATQQPYYERLAMDGDPNSWPVR